MKISYLSNSIIPSPFANTINVLKMSNAFIKHGHEVNLFGFKGESNLINEEYNVDKCLKLNLFTHYKLKKVGILIYAFKVYFKLKNNVPDLIYGRCAQSIFISTFLKVPFIYEAHDIPSNYLRYKLEYLIFKSKNFKKLVVISNELKQDYIKIYPFLDLSKITIAHDGADNFISPELAEDEINNFKIKKSVKIGYFGSLYPGKGLEIITKLSFLFKDDQFIIYGGSEKEIDYWKSKTNQNVVFKGRVPHNETPLLMRSMDILLLPLLNKVETSSGGNIAKYTSPIKLFEYMSSFRPVIATDLDVLKEILSHEENSMLCHYDVISSWVMSIEKIKNNPIFAFNISQKAFFDFHANYTWFQRARIVLD
jgi:glycosyltransferase involved in cell wall biosynthesis